MSSAAMCFLTCIGIYFAGLWISIFWWGYQHGSFKDCDDIEFAMLLLWPISLVICFLVAFTFAMEDAWDKVMETRAKKYLKFIGKILWYALLPLRPLTLGKYVHEKVMGRKNKKEESKE